MFTQNFTFLIRSSVNQIPGRQGVCLRAGSGQGQRQHRGTQPGTESSLHRSPSLHPKTRRHHTTKRGICHYLNPAKQALPPFRKRLLMIPVFLFHSGGFPKALQLRPAEFAPASLRKIRRQSDRPEAAPVQCQHLMSRRGEHPLDLMKLAFLHSHPAAVRISSSAGSAVKSLSTIPAAKARCSFSLSLPATRAVYTLSTCLPGASSR